jgi:hypothetical protein
MPVFCVTYDLGERGDQDYAGVIAAIRSLGPAAEMTESTWLVRTEVDSEEITTVVSAAAGEYAKLVVFGVGEMPGSVIAPPKDDRMLPLVEFVNRYVIRGE